MFLYLIAAKKLAKVCSPEDLHVLRYIWGKVLYCPGSQDCVLIGGSLISVVPGGQDEAGLRLVHAGTCQIAILQTRTLQAKDIGHRLQFLVIWDRTGNSIPFASIGWTGFPPIGGETLIYLNVNDTLRPNRHLQDHPHGGVELHGAQ